MVSRVQWIDTPMSNAPSTLPRHTTETADDRTATLQSLAESAVRPLQAPIQLAGFWSAILLPFVYAPMVVGGITPGQQPTFLGLLALHAVALVAGHGYRNN